MPDPFTLAHATRLPQNRNYGVAAGVSAWQGDPVRRSSYIGEFQFGCLYPSALKKGPCVAGSHSRLRSARPIPLRTGDDHATQSRGPPCQVGSGRAPAATWWAAPASRRVESSVGRGDTSGVINRGMSVQTRAPFRPTTLRTAPLPSGAAGGGPGFQPVRAGRQSEIDVGNAGTVLCQQCSFRKR